MILKELFEIFASETRKGMKYSLSKYSIKVSRSFASFKNLISFKKLDNEKLRLGYKLIR